MQRLARAALRAKYVPAGRPVHLCQLRSDWEGDEVHGSGRRSCCSPQVTTTAEKSSSTAVLNAVVLGARHSTISLAEAGAPGTVPGLVYAVELTGDLTFVHVRLGNAMVVISVPPQARLRPDQTVHVQFDQQRLHLFDAATGQALV